MVKLMKDAVRKELLSMQDEAYKSFHSKLMPTVDADSVIGIRVPILRKYAKKLENYEDFHSDLPHKYYEENNLHAFLIEREKDFDKCIELLENFLPFVDNWATCDSMKPPVLKKYPEKLLKYIKKWIASKDTYKIRYAVNLLMSYYLDENFDASFVEYVLKIKSDEYYVNMMRAWYFATALSKRYEELLPYIESGALDLWTHNKAIQKSIESLRISKEQKEYLKTLKK